jgi:hypothetical protein
MNQRGKFKNKFFEHNRNCLQITQGSKRSHSWAIHVRWPIGLEIKTEESQAGKTSEFGVNWLYSTHFGLKIEILMAILKVITPSLNFF